MAADNTQLANGDVIRDLARQGGLVKTQAMQIDIGGPSSNAEVLLTAGQQVAAASMPVVLASNQPPISVSAPAANDSFGQAAAATAGSTSTLASLSAPAGYRIAGLIGNGTGDGYFVVQVAGATVFSGRTRSTLPTLALMLPHGIPVSTGALVTLKVTNESGSTADFDGTLLGA